MKYTGRGWTIGAPAGSYGVRYELPAEFSAMDPTNKNWEAILRRSRKETL